jgi:hypothetical protein
MGSADIDALDAILPCHAWRRCLGAETYMYWEPPQWFSSSRVIVLHHPNPLVNLSGVDTQPLEVTLTSVHSLLPSLSLLYV